MTESAQRDLAPLAASRALRPRRSRKLIVAAIAVPATCAGLWLAVHHVPGFGPAVADGLRAVAGKRFVAWLEDAVYGAEDWFNRHTRAHDKPESAWDVPPAASAAPARAAPDACAPAAPPAFSLASIGPMHAELATPGEGVWLPLPDPRHPADRVRLLKAFVHPDKNRSWAIVAVVAADLAAVELKPMAGSAEPQSRTPEAKSYVRQAVVPAEERDALIGAFNGSYKSTHGYYGMKVDGVTLTPGRPRACTILRYRGGAYAIAPWETVRDREPEMAWFRQAPLCMVDEGKPNPLLDSSLGWGAASVAGTTVIRRSAIGIDAEGKVLFVGIGDAVTGKTIAMAMRHAGAAYVSQLDVNYSFPKFVTYDYKEPGSRELKAIPLTKKFEYAEDQYVGHRSDRDFFYLLRKR